MYDFTKFQEGDFPPSITIQDAEMTIQQYLAMTASGTSVPVHDYKYQSEGYDKELTPEDIDYTKSSGFDIYDANEVIRRDFLRKSEVTYDEGTKRSEVTTEEGTNVSQNGTSEARQPSA